MSLSTNITSIRDYIATQIHTVTGLATLKIYLQEQEQNAVAPYAVVKIGNCERVPAESNSVQDGYQLTYSIGLVLQRGSNPETVRFQYVDDIRLALLEGTGFTAGYAPQVDMIDFGDTDVLDDIITVSFTFMCRTQVLRRAS